MRHNDIPLGFMHPPFNWVYANSAARLAAGGFAAGDVNKIALDGNTGLIWAVSSVDGTGAATWMQVGGSASATLDQVPAPVADVSFAGHKATLLADATAAQDAMNQRASDARYAPIGRTLDAVPAPAADVSLNNHKATLAADATAAQDLMNQRSADARYAAIGSGGGTVGTAAGSATRTAVILTPTGVGLRDFVSAADAPFNVVPDATTIAFTSVTGSTLNSTSAAASHVGKLVNIPGAGADDGAGVKDGFTTTVSGAVAGTSLTLTNAVPNAVSTGANRNAALSTDWTSALASFVTAVGALGAHGWLPAGNIGYTQSPDFGTALGTGKGLGFVGQGTGGATTSGAGGTSLWYFGPVNSTANGAGAPAIQCTSTTGKNGLKMGSFGIRCLRALAVSTAVTAGQTLSTTPITLTLTGSAAGLPTVGRAKIGTFAAGIEFFWTGVSGSTLTGAAVTSGTYTTLAGDVARLITGGVYWDFIAQSDISNVHVAAYFDSNNSNANLNQGRGWWMNNFTSGYCTITRCHCRYFQGGEDSWRYGTCTAGWGVRGNGGNCVVMACTAFDCTKGFFLQGSSLVDGVSFLSLKVTGGAGAGALGVAPDGETTYGMKIDSGYCTTVSSFHSEGCFYGITSAAVNGVTINSPVSTYQGASSGDNSAALNFTGNASGHSVNGAGYSGWTGGSSGAPTGTPGYSYGTQFGNSTGGNFVFQRTTSGFAVPGTATVNYGTSATNRYVDMGNVPGGDAGTGQQAGAFAPDGRLPGGGSNLLMVANTAYFSRLVPSRPIPAIRIAYNLSTAATVNDNLDVGVYSVVGTTLVKVASSGSTAGKANLAGVGSIVVGANLQAGVVYYIAIAYGTVGGTAATIQGKSYNSASNGGMFGSAVGTSDCATLAAGFPLPAGPITPALNANATPELAVRET